MVVISVVCYKESLNIVHLQKAPPESCLHGLAGKGLVATLAIIRAFGF